MRIPPQYCNLDQRGFVLCRVTKAKFHSEFHFVSDVRRKRYEHFCSAAFDVRAGDVGHMKKSVRYLVSGLGCQPGQPAWAAGRESAAGAVYSCSARPAAAGKQPAPALPRHSQSIDGAIPTATRAKRTALLRSVRDISRRMQQHGEP